MFQQKIDEIFNDMAHVFGIADNILVAGYDTDGKGHDDTVQRVLHRCRETNLKLNKERCHFSCTSVPFREVNTRNGVQLDPQKIRALMEIPPPHNKKSSRLFWPLLTI